MTTYPAIKFVIDAGVGRSIEEWLISQNFVVLSIVLINPEMSDIEILNLAFREDAIIITMDKDFGELVYKNNSLHKGILLLRLEDAVAEEKLAAIQNIIPKHLQKFKNNFSVYQNGKLRTR
jgi:predicted nuclease of predicted toxin-antitoxin system